MLVVFADDKAEVLTLAERWFDRKYREDSEMSIRTVNDLGMLEETVANIPADDRPVLILLDLNWNGDKKNTLKLIGRIKRSRARRCWPILVYSESTDDQDVYDSHFSLANGYVHKGDNQEDQFLETVEHWRARQRLPNVMGA